MKVGILCENYFPTLGGEQEHILNLRRHLECPRDGSPPVDVRIIVPQAASGTWHGPADDERVLRPARSIRIHGYGSASECTLTPHAFFALRRLFARERFDLLHMHAPCDIGLCNWALWTYRGPIVGTIHSYFSHTAIRNMAAPWYRYVMQRMTRVIAVSETARDTIARYARFDCRVIPNGVDCDAFERGQPMPNFADGKTNILSVARLEPRNGIDLIIGAFARLAVRRSDVRLIVAGDGPARADCERQVAHLPPSIGARVVFLGAIWTERLDLFASAHCFALGARKTSFSISMLEAFAAGLPVAAVPGEGAQAAGDHWSLATIADSATPEAYADALDKALASSTPLDVARRRSMARTYDWTRIVPQIRAVYDEALASFRGSAEALAER